LLCLLILTCTSVCAYEFVTGQNASYSLYDDADVDGFFKVFVNNGDGTVTDYYTGLMWAYAPGPAVEWQNAIIYCNNNATAGYTDWRVPNLLELMSVMDYSCPSSTPSHCWNRYFNAALSWSGVYAEHWASTTHTTTTTEAYYFDSQFGRIAYQAKTSTEPVRCVRG